MRLKLLLTSLAQYLPQSVAGRVMSYSRIYNAPYFYGDSWLFKTIFNNPGFYFLSVVIGCSFVLWWCDRYREQGFWPHFIAVAAILFGMASGFGIIPTICNFIHL